MICCSGNFGAFCLDVIKYPHSFFNRFFIMQEVMSKHGLLNIEELNSSHPSSLVLFAEVVRHNTSQKFLPAYQIRRVFTSASQH